MRLDNSIGINRSVSLTDVGEIGPKIDWNTQYIIVVIVNTNNYEKCNVRIQVI